MRALVLAAALTAAGCAPRPVVSAAVAAGELCDGPDAWPLVVEGGRLFVDVVADGPRGPAPLRLMIDTGGNAHGVALYGRAAARLGARDVAELPRALRVGGRIVSMPEGASWVLVDDASPTSLVARARPGECDGQIGAGWLSRRRVCVDAVARRMGLGDPRASTIAADEAAAPLLLAEEAPLGARYAFVRADIAGEPRTLLVDTGASAGMLHERAFAPLTARGPWAEVAAGDWDMIAGAHATERVSSGALSIAGRSLGAAVFVSRADGTFPALFTALPGGGPDGVLGADVWSRHRVLVDWSSGRLFSWPTAAPTPPAARVPISISFDLTGCPTVARAAADAQAEGLAPGDRLLRIEGREACGVSHAELSRWLAAPEGKRLSVGRARAGRVEELAVTSRGALPRAPITGLDR
ncbi:MAG: hypothetical protein IT374_16910 [Polyangiaceae bacterium]|nr:hypothetical protein [Polyangiaceae bacterium]